MADRTSHQLGNYRLERLIALAALLRFTWAFMSPWAARPPSNCSSSQEV